MNISDLTTRQKAIINSLVHYFRLVNKTKGGDKSKQYIFDMYDSIDFVYAKFNEYDGLFTEEKINKDIIKALPNFIYHYDIRHDDDGRGNPVTLENNVAVNRFGTFLTYQKIDFGDKDYIDIYENNMIDYCHHIKLTDFIAKAVKNAYKNEYFDKH